MRGMHPPTVSGQVQLMSAVFEVVLRSAAPSSCDIDEISAPYAHGLCDISLAVQGLAAQLELSGSEKQLFYLVL